MTNLQEGFHRLKEAQSGFHQQVKDKVQEIEMVTSETKIKTESLNKQVMSFEHVKFDFMDSLQNKGPTDNHQHDIQLGSLRETALNERQKNETQFDELNRLHQNLILQTHSIKADMMTKLKEHRDEYLAIFNQAEEERGRSEKMKHEKHGQDNFNFNQLF
jgi:hypothetical protein